MPEAELNNLARIGLLECLQQAAALIQLAEQQLQAFMDKKAP
jgi:hypothetical protein